jgi:hypothetical protein
MSFLIQLAGTGEYLVDYLHEQPEPPVTTRFKARARRFDTSGAAQEFWRQRSTTRPTTPDGLPHRPFTAWPIRLVRLEDGFE